MAKSVGLEIHARGVRAVEISGRGRSFRITRYLDRPVHPRGGAPDPEELKVALGEIFRGGRFSRSSVIGSLEAGETMVREIPVPFKGDDQIRKVVKFEAEHHLHDCNAEDVIVQYTRVGESKEGANLLVFAARKEDISRRIEYARGVGVEPLAMDLDAMGVYGAVRAAGLFDDGAAFVLLHIAHRSTEMIFVSEGELRALRSVRMGIDSITQGLARDMDIDFSEADIKLAGIRAEGESGDLLLPGGDASDRKETEKSHAELERDLFAQKRDEFTARLKREFVRSRAAMRTGGEFRILASGAGIAVPGLLDHLGQRLGQPVETFRPSEAFGYRGREPGAEAFDAGATVALGLALKGLGEDPLDLDFRQEELTVANRFELLKNTLAVTVTLLFLCLMGISFYALYKKNSLKRERFDALLTEAYKPFSDSARRYNDLGESIVPPEKAVNVGAVETGGPPHDAIRRIVNSLRSMSAHLLRTAGGDKGIPQITSALHIWNEVFGAVGKIHKELGYVDFELIEVKQESVTINTMLRSAGDGERLEASLKQVPVLQDMDLEAWRAVPVPGSDLQRIRYNFRDKRSRR